MAKTTRTRHSKTKREPVTIDLKADEVKREQGAAEDAKEKQADAAGPEAGAEQQAQQPPAGEAEAADGKPAERAEDFKPAGNEPESRAKHGSKKAGKEESREEAEPTDGAAAQSPEEPRTKAERPRTSGGAGRALAAGVAGGVVALVLAGALQWAEVLPVPGTRGEDPAAAALREDIESLRSEMRQLRDTASAAVSEQTVEQALTESRQQIGALRETVTALEEAVAAGQAGEGPGLETLQTRMSELENRLTELAGSIGQAGGNGELAERISAFESEVADFRDSLAEVSEGVSANSERLSALAEQVEAEDEGPRLALVVAASALRSAVERGEPFASELETYSALAPEGQALAPLEQYADMGIPTRAELARQAPDVASAIVAAASAPPPDAGLIDRLLASARSAVSVRPVGEVEGESVAAIAARMEAAVLEGNYGRALSEYESLPPEAQDVARAFADRLRARQAADEALDKALANALNPA